MEPCSAGAFRKGMLPVNRAAFWWCGFLFIFLETPSATAGEIKMATASIFKSLILREIRKCGGNLFNLPAISKERLIEWTCQLKADELHLLEDRSDDTLSGLMSSRFQGTAAECCDKWLADRLADFLAGWEKKHPREVTLNLIENAVSDIRFWVRESMETFCFRELSDEYFPDALLEDDFFHYEAIQYNPVFWVAFEMLHQNLFDQSRSVTELVEAFDKTLFDTRFVFAVSQTMNYLIHRGVHYDELQKRNAA